MVRNQRLLAPAIEATVLPNSDLWCTYAACRTLKWLDAEIATPHRQHTINVLTHRRNRDGGFAWTRGMPSDAWATFYCSHALTDLGSDDVDRDALAAWVEQTRTADGAFAMMPGQLSDIWATHYAVRVIAEICRRPLSEPDALLGWLARCQSSDGGLTWSPAHSETGRLSDVRACFYGIAAWRAAAQFISMKPPWNTERLVRWMKNQQTNGGGFRFHAAALEPCLWASFRASTALAMLDEQPTISVDAYLREVLEKDGPVRWRGYDLPDVWAAFCWVGTARAVRYNIPDKQRELIVHAIANMQLPTGGYTYREPHRAADSLAVASAALINSATGREEPTLIDWLNGCQMPNEGGIMYMPGRGAEVRCTHWALSAGALRDNPSARSTAATWLAGMQNPDGGFGYWEGRASDLVSTASAVETALTLLASPASLDTEAVKKFVHKCAKADGTFSVVPGAASTARSTLQALRILNLLDEDVKEQAHAVINRHQAPSGGIAATGRRLPDLATTYEAVVTSQRVGLSHLITDLGSFLARLTSGKAVSWSPLAPPTDELMPAALAALLRSSRADTPALALS